MPSDAGRELESSDVDQRGGGRPLAGYRVLVAEDSWLVGGAMCKLLRRAGADVVGLAPTETELRRLVASSNPDLVIADVNLRGVEILPLIAELASAGRSIVVVTGYDDTADRLRGCMPAVLRKPVAFDELLASACAALRRP